MSDTKFLSCQCTQCGGAIPCPVESIGQSVPCPHCGQVTELVLAVPELPSTGAGRNFKWALAGSILLVLGLIASLVALGWARRLGNKTRPVASDAVAAPAPLASPQAPRLHQFEASPVQLEKTPGSRLVYAVSTLRNLKSEPRQNLAVELELFAESGASLGVAQERVDRIEAQGEWSFRILLLKDGVHHARVSMVREP